MGRRPCCSKEINKGAWSREEDETLSKYVAIHGEGKWQKVAQNAGLKRCGKSCRQRWLNYLKPGIKRGDISEDEEDMIIRLHRLLGNRWALIAKRLPGRTDNEIKNYWNTNLSKKLQNQQQPPPPPSSSSSHKHKHNHVIVTPQATMPRRPKAVHHHNKIIFDDNNNNNSINCPCSDNEEASLADFLIDIDDDDQMLLANPIEEHSNDDNNNKVLLGLRKSSPSSSSSDQCNNKLLLSEKFDPLETLLDVELKRMASFLGLKN
ncbi:hypothetical protein PIB30_077628 [Stylosanthes scabra]|uniref:Uncharacterized protein n=1 Tax=Stylosanthes scabra TaxID=79078 RepID=A0ABU6RQP8_9FABA|nr:hypothetical protein [Stylosanthes scabra]